MVVTLHDDGVIRHTDADLSIDVSGYQPRDVVIVCNLDGSPLIPSPDPVGGWLTGAGWTQPAAYNAPTFFSTSVHYKSLTTADIAAGHLDFLSWVDADETYGVALYFVLRGADPDHIYAGGDNIPWVWDGSTAGLVEQVGPYDGGHVGGAVLGFVTFAQALASPDFGTDIAQTSAQESGYGILAMFAPLASNGTTPAYGYSLGTAAGPDAIRTVVTTGLVIDPLPDMAWTATRLNATSSGIEPTLASGAANGQLTGAAPVYTRLPTIVAEPIASVSSGSSEETGQALVDWGNGDTESIPLFAGAWNIETVRGYDTPGVYDVNVTVMRDIDGATLSLYFGQLVVQSNDPNLAADTGPYRVAFE